MNDCKALKRALFFKQVNDEKGKNEEDYTGKST